MVSLFDGLRKTAVDDKGCVSGVLRGMLHRSDDGIVRLAPGVAKRILEEANFDGQRGVKASRVDRHLARIKLGSWCTGFPITFAQMPDGELILIDGQHRVTAVSMCEAPVDVRINIIKVTEPVEVRRLYIGFDAADGVRSKSEVLDGVGLGEKLNIKRSVRNAAFDALGLIRNKFEFARNTQADTQNAISTEGRISEFPEWESEIIKWNHIHTISDRAHARSMIGAGVTAVGLYTLKYQPARAMDFWTGVARNDGLRKKDPRHTLIQDFHTRVLNGGSRRQSVQAPTLAWNAFFENRPLSIIKCLEGAVIRMSGTPFAGGPGEE